MNKDGRKTKILFVITKSNFGGAQKYVYDLARNLPKDNFEVAVIVGEQGVLVDKLNEQKIRVITIPTLGRDVKPLKDFVSFIKLWKIFRIERPDIIHLNSAKASGLGAVSGRLAGIPKIIFTAHGWAFNEDRSSLARIVIKILSWITLFLCNETIAVSTSVSDSLGWAKMGREITVIRNGIEQVDFFERADARNLVSESIHTVLPPEAFLIGTIAELHPNKGLPYAIEAFAELIPKNPNLYYVILGDGQEREHLHSLIERYKIQNRVYLAGFVTDVARYLKALDLFILPSTTEALGYVLLEAGLAKLPVIATTVGGIPEIIEDGVSGLLVSPRNPRELIDKIEQMIKQPEQRARLGIALNNKITNDFTLERAISQTISLYARTGR